MKIKVHLLELMHWIAALMAICLLSACAFSRGVVNHSFAFNVEKDGQDAEVLDYRYGKSKLPVRAPEEYVRQGKTFLIESVHGPMLRGDFLYVKWRIKSTGMVYEDTVELRSRMPWNIENHTVYFMVRGPQLYVYLISPELRPPDAPDIGPKLYRSKKITQVYPDS